MSVRQYIGSRYVPVFADPIQWSNKNTYEPLTIVLNEGNSYTSRQYVPAGIDIGNEDFWALTGNYNAQIEQYRKEVSDLSAKTPRRYSTAADMQRDTSLKPGDLAETEGYSTPNDGGGASYVIGQAEQNGFDILPISNGYTASMLLTGVIRIEQIGYTGGDCSSYLDHALDMSDVRLMPKQYDCSNAVTPTKEREIQGGGATIRVMGDAFMLLDGNNISGQMIRLKMKNLTLEGNGTNTAIDFRSVGKVFADNVTFNNFDTALMARAMILNSFSNCTFSNNVNAIKCAETPSGGFVSNSNANAFNTCYFVNNKTVIADGGGNYGSGWGFNNCQIEINGQSDSPLFTFASDSTTVCATFVGCWIESSKGASVFKLNNLATLICVGCRFISTANYLANLVSGDETAQYVEIGSFDPTVYSDLRLKTVFVTQIGCYPMNATGGIPNANTNMINKNYNFLGEGLYGLTTLKSSSNEAIAQFGVRSDEVYLNNTSGIYNIVTSWQHPLSLGTSMFIWNTGTGHVRFSLTKPTSNEDGTQIW